MEISISVVIATNFSWVIEIPSLTNPSITTFSQFPLEIASSEVLKQILCFIDTCHLCIGNEIEKYAPVLEKKAHNGIFINAQGIYS